jgi:hypothetical protein
MLITYLLLAVLGFIVYIVVLRGNLAEPTVPLHTSQQHERGSTAREGRGSGEVLFIALFVIGALGIIFIR